MSKASRPYKELLIESLKDPEQAVAYLNAALEEDEEKKESYELFLVALRNVAEAWGLNYQKKGLRVLIKRICKEDIGRLVLTHKDRLLRFGSELIFSLCEHFGVEVTIINASEDSSFEEELVSDVLEIITVFSARLYGSRSHKNKKVMEKLKEAANEIST